MEVIFSTLTQDPVNSWQEWGLAGAMIGVLLALFGTTMLLILRAAVKQVDNMRSDVHAMIQQNQKQNERFIDYLQDEARRRERVFESMTERLDELTNQIRDLRRMSE